MVKTLADPCRQGNPFVAAGFSRMHLPRICDGFP